MTELTLHIPLDQDEVHTIIDSLKDNHSVEWLWLSERYLSQYFTDSEQQALDPRVILQSLLPPFKSSSLLTSSNLHMYSTPPTSVST